MSQICKEYIMSKFKALILFELSRQYLNIILKELIRFQKKISVVNENPLSERSIE